jgi:hypothetical protein
MTGSEQDRIAFPYPDALSLLGCFKIPWHDAGPWLQILDTALGCYVEQHPSGDDPPCARDIQLRSARLCADARSRNTVVRSAVPEDMRESVDVRDLQAVKTKAYVLGSQSSPASELRLDRKHAVLLKKPLTAPNHETLRSAAWTMEAMPTEWPGARDHNALANKRRSAATALVVNVVQCSKLIIVTPTAPITEFGDESDYGRIIKRDIAWIDGTHSEILFWIR